MSAEYSRSLHERELAFFGRISADATHDMRNILAIINENAGLLEDLAARTGPGGAIDGEKASGIAAKIAAQVVRGTEAMRVFSAFAHATDREVADCDLAAVAANTAVLMRRRLAAVDCATEVSAESGAVAVRTNPFLLQYAVASAIRLVAEGARQPGKIALTVVQGDESAIVAVKAAGPGGDSWEAGVAELSVMMSELNGRLVAAKEGDMLSLVLDLPGGR